MSYACYCDFDPAECYQQKTVTARKQHRCTECDGPINSGESYDRATMLFEGHWLTCRTCQHCLPMAEWVMRNCGCLGHGDLWRHLEEDVWSESRHDLPPGVGFKVGRWIIGKRRRTSHLAVRP